MQGPTFSAALTAALPRVFDPFSRHASTAPATRCVRGVVFAFGLGVATASIGHAMPLQLQVTSDNGTPLAGAAVSVFVKGAKTTAPPGTTADMAQKNKRFQPTLLVVQTGTSVLFPNLDTVRHHVYSFSPTHPFEIKLYAGTPSSPVLFDKAGTATLGCNIHDTMLGYIHVVDTPYFGVTDATGRVRLDLPAGEHRVRVWTPAMGESEQGGEQPLKPVGDSAVVRIKP